MVYDFDMGEWEEAPPSVHLSLPLAADVHPCNLDDVTNLERERETGGSVTGGAGLVCNKSMSEF